MKPRSSDLLLTAVSRAIHLGISVTCQAGVLNMVIGSEVGLAAADMVEEDDFVVRFKGRRNMPPHVLIAAEAVCKDHGTPSFAPHGDIVPC